DRHALVHLVAGHVHGLDLATVLGVPSLDRGLEPLGLGHQVRVLLRCGAVEVPEAQRSVVAGGTSARGQKPGAESRRRAAEQATSRQAGGGWGSVGSEPHGRASWRTRRCANGESKRFLSTVRASRGGVNGACEVWVRQGAKTPVSGV